MEEVVGVEDYPLLLFMERLWRQRRQIVVIIIISRCFMHHTRREGEGVALVLGCFSVSC